MVEGENGKLSSDSCVLWQAPLNKYNKKIERKSPDKQPLSWFPPASECIHPVFRNRSQMVLGVELQPTPKQATGKIRLEENFRILGC